ncbi:MAG TPA: sulfotransferase [Rhizomicrobium sp.]|jgi:tetratricopeptide (TPR) repeat protein|nr:sulfotransferase [Rhizomicrobium sp.]
MNAIGDIARFDGRAASDAEVEAHIAALLDALLNRRPLRNANLREARKAFEANRIDIAERLLRDFLKRHPHDPDALYLLAQCLLRREFKSDAEALLADCLTRAPDFDAARFNYANTLHQMNKPVAALAESEKLLAKEPYNPIYRDLQALALTAMGEFERAVACRQALAEEFPQGAKVLVSYAQTLRTTGKRDACVAVYRAAIANCPSLGTAWWGLANLKNYRFDEADITRLEAELAARDLSPDDRVQLLFSLGKAYGDIGRYAGSFDAYGRANAMRRMQSNYDGTSLSAQVQKCKALFTPAFFADRAGNGASGKAPIFIVGMQRSGTTLLEQVLASHSQIEGAGELPNLRFMARRLEDTIGRRLGLDYPGVLAHLDPADFRKLGEEFLEATRPRRPLGRPFFVDKDPFNFWHTGFIQLILPDATIIDMRRHPLGCCFSNFTTIFLHRLAHTYRLSDLGRFYAGYVEMMAHYDRVLPGRVRRVFYEDLVADPEKEIRKLFDHLELPFEPSCLRFHENRRAVNSASSEQVRMRIYQEALDHWRHYEPWLGPLKTALGPVLERYPGVPDFPE